MPWFSSTFFGITRTTTLTCQRSQVGVLSRPSPECSNARPLCDIRRDELTRHAHCLIAPTGRTRRDPDHRVTDLRRGVAEIALGRQRTGLRLPNDRNRLAVYAGSLVLRAGQADTRWCEGDRAGASPARYHNPRVVGSSPTAATRMSPLRKSGA